MSSAEIFPALMGFVLGLLLRGRQPTIRRWLIVPLVVFLGISATVTSGEFRISWEFLWADIPLVAVTMLAGLAARTLFEAARRSRTVE